jgi:ABC-type multidrug transport system ATPase subunit
VLEVQGLGKRYGLRWVFRGISFQLQAGDSLVVLGHNGSGKSTLLRTIAGLLSPTEGTVQRPEGDERTRVGMVALDMALYAHLTVREHLELSAKLRGCPARTDALIEQVGLNSASERFAGQLSTGMKARLKIAIAIQPRPALLLLDEPGAGLDDQGRELVKQVAAEQRSRGVLVVATNEQLERRLGTLELQLAS